MFMLGCVGNIILYFSFYYYLIHIFAIEKKENIKIKIDEIIQMRNKIPNPLPLKRII